MLFDLFIFVYLDIFVHISINRPLNTWFCEYLLLIGRVSLSISAPSHLDTLDHPYPVRCGHFQR